MFFKQKSRSPDEICQELRERTANLEVTTKRQTELSEMFDKSRSQVIALKCAALKTEARLKKLERQLGFLCDLVLLNLVPAEIHAKGGMAVNARLTDEQLEGLDDILDELDYPDQATESVDDAIEQI